MTFVKKILRKALKKRWFEEINETKLLTSYIQSPSDTILPFMKKEKYDTLVINLLESEEELLSNCSSNCRNEIRRGMKENLQIKYRHPSLSDAKFYDLFASRMSIGNFNRRYLGDLKAISSSIYKNNICIAMHLYVVEKKVSRARLIYSAQVESSEIVNMDLGALNAARFTGIANRYLHYEDMKYFKSQQVKVYDLGGLGSDESNLKIKGINKFKKSFGGESTSEYNYIPVIIVALQKMENLMV